MRDTDVTGAPGAVLVRLPDGRISRFTTAFFIGRDPACELRLSGSQVSRRHAEVSPAPTGWVIRDLQSSNGLFVDGARVATAALGDGIEARFGADGPTVQIDPERYAAAASRPSAPVVAAPSTPELPAEESAEEYAQRYFGAVDDDEAVGGRTLMIRKVYHQIQQRQRRRQRVVVAVLAAIGIGVGAYAWYQHQLLQRNKEEAEEFFYAMKDLDVRVALLEAQAAAAGTTITPQPELIAARQAQERRYDERIARLYDRKLDETDRLILKVTRTFGECEIAAPPAYMREVRRYIEKWKSTKRFENAVKLSQQRGFVPHIVSTFTARGLPPQFYYLALQESSFDPFATGSPTNWGYAKGMWQFIPDTARRYGLKVGPRAAFPGTDIGDDRFNWEKATDAAARYIKDIYSTDAQASGLLVMASYNWGERRVVDRLRKMRADPRERNFWKLLENYRDDVPWQTYDYVFNIVSAAVIGENPRLFGFDFDSPLKVAAAQNSAH